MAYDEGLAQLMRDDLADRPGIAEKKMFGGICRVGKEREAAALAIEGAGEMTFTGRRMSGMVDVSEDCLSDEDARAALMALALANAAALPPK
jgi:hypothetical protein